MHYVIQQSRADVWFVGCTTRTALEVYVFRAITRLLKVCPASFIRDILIHRQYVVFVTLRAIKFWVYDLCMICIHLLMHMYIDARTYV